MIKRVIGTVDGNEVILTNTGGNRWEVPVPLDEDGEYVVEIMAEDEAGNWSYVTKMLFAVSRALLCTHVLEFPYYAKLLGDCKQASLIPEEYFAEAEILGNYQVSLCDAGYWAEMIEPECEGF